MEVDFSLPGGVHGANLHIQSKGVGGRRIMSEIMLLGIPLAYPTLYKISSKTTTNCKCLEVPHLLPLLALFLKFSFWTSFSIPIYLHPWVCNPRLTIFNPFGVKPGKTFSLTSFHRLTFLPAYCLTFLLSYVLHLPYEIQLPRGNRDRKTIRSRHPVIWQPGASAQVAAWPGELGVYGVQALPEISPPL